VVVFFIETLRSHTTGLQEQQRALVAAIVSVWFIQHHYPCLGAVPVLVAAVRVPAVTSLAPVVIIPVAFPPAVASSAIVVLAAFSSPVRVSSVSMVLVTPVVVMGTMLIVHIHDLLFPVVFFPALAVVMVFGLGSLAS